MLVYRVFGFHPDSKTGQSGHPDYLHDQGGGRIDNPNDYDLWYFARTPEAAIGETFGDQREWSDDMFPTPWLAGGRRVLGTYRIPTDTKLLNLDDANALRERALRPSQIIERNRAATQSWADGIFAERTHDGSRKWQGVRWWSYHRPEWEILGLWMVPGQAPLHTYQNHMDLSVSHYLVTDAAEALNRAII